MASDALVALEDLDVELRDRRRLPGRIRVHAGIRSPATTRNPATLPLLQFDSLVASTAKILAGPPAQSENPVESEFRTGEANDWWGGVSALLTAAGIVQPTLDPVILRELDEDRRRLRFFCDTNTLCGGTAAWTLEAFQGRADLVTSAIVDRELMAMADRQPGLWKAMDSAAFAMRAKYRLARRLTEVPPKGVVVDRLAPDQSALMLAKLRDELPSQAGSAARRTSKSADADILLVELVRGLVRDEPLNARVVFLTGDRNLARTASNVLGASAVFYVACDDHAAREAVGRVCSRGWWYPGGSLGHVHLPSIGSVLWTLLAGFDFLVLQSDDECLLVRPAVVGRGVPSDWRTPHLQILSLDPLSLPGLSPSPTVPPMARRQRPAPTTSATASPSPTERSSPSSSRQASPPPTTWLLPPTFVGPPVQAAPSLRLKPELVFAQLSHALFDAASDSMSGEVAAEVHRALLAVGAVDRSGAAGPRADVFRQHWIANDLDSLHAEFRRLESYERSLNVVRESPRAPLPERPRRNIALARRLGQVATVDGKLLVGDSALTVAALLEFLDRHLPRIGSSELTSKLCLEAVRALQVTPARFEAAMTNLWQLPEGAKFGTETGGTVSNANAETVVSLRRNGYAERIVAPDSLTFGGARPARVIVRRA